MTTSIIASALPGFAYGLLGLIAPAPPELWQGIMTLIFLLLCILIFIVWYINSVWQQRHKQKSQTALYAKAWSEKRARTINDSKTQLLCFVKQLKEKQLWQTSDEERLSILDEECSDYLQNITEDPEVNYYSYCSLHPYEGPYTQVPFTTCCWVCHHYVNKVDAHIELLALLFKTKLELAEAKENEKQKIEAFLAEIERCIVKAGLNTYTFSHYKLEKIIRQVTGNRLVIFPEESIGLRRLDALPLILVADELPNADNYFNPNDNESNIEQALAKLKQDLSDAWRHLTLQEEIDIIAANFYA